MILKGEQSIDAAAREALGSALTAVCSSGEWTVLAVEENAAEKVAEVFATRKLAISQAGELRHAGQLFRDTAEASGDLHGSAVISKMIRLIADELGNPNLSLKWAAKDMLFMNPDYLGKLFKQETGEKFSQYVTRVRLEHAMKQMKMRRDASVSEIAEEIGFGDNPKYFSLVFKKYTGLTPSEFRRKQGGASAG